MMEWSNHAQYLTATLQVRGSMKRALGGGAVLVGFIVSLCMVVIMTSEMWQDESHLLQDGRKSVFKYAGLDPVSFSLSLT